MNSLMRCPVVIGLLNKSLHFVRIVYMEFGEILYHHVVVVIL